MPEPDFKTMIESIRDHNEITEVIGSYLQLKRVGGSFKACCPFHKEKTPSFHVNATRQSFHCFGCGAGGDVFNFIMRQENLDFIEAARRLAERAGLTFELSRERGNAPAETPSQRDALLQLHAKLKDWYQRCLLESNQAAVARDYLKERDLGQDAIERFGIGYAPFRDVNWSAWASKRSIDMELLVKAGVLIRREEGGWYDRFSNRLMFPICDDSGRVIGFSGRILPGDERPAKYVNSPETPLFTKSKVIYALHLAKREILDREEAIICEGQIDVIRCHLAGITHAVAAQGTAITEQHARILKRFTNAVRLVLDSDDAGQNAALRSGDVLIEGGLQVRVASLPPGDDPDSMIRRDGGSNFRNLVDAAAPFLDFKADLLSQREKNNDEAALMRTARALLETAMRLPSDVQRTQWMERIGRRLGIRPDLIASEMRIISRRAPRNRSDEDPAESEPAADAPPSHPREELEIIRLIMRHRLSAETLRVFVAPRHFRSEVCREIYTILLEHAYAEHFDLMAELLGAESRRVAAMLMAEEKFAGTEFAADKIAQDLIIALYKREFDQERRTLEARLRNPGSPENARQLEMEIMEITLHQHTLRSGWEKARPMLEMLSSMQA